MKPRKNKIGVGALAVLVFTITVGFLFFGNVEKTYAAGSCCYVPKDKTAQQCDQGIVSKDACDKLCADNNSKMCVWFDKSDPSKTNFLGITSGGQDLSKANGLMETAIAWLLTGVLYFAGKLLSLSGTLFAMIVDVKNFNTVFHGTTSTGENLLYAVWKLVRDFLNIAFILVLLYSAFCTILQIESYNYKKILLKLVIMALLVNFSFPITRFIIDASNVLMYTIINTLFGTTINSQFANITHGGGIDAILALNSSASLPNLLAAIVFVFILAITLLAIGILLVIRLVVLAMLLIFSPLAFVATIFPDTGGYSSKWWDNLFRYSFFGPIMLFVIYIATQMLAAASSLQKSALANAQSNSLEPGLIGTMAFFTVPIVILWLGMGVAQSMSIAGAATVMGGAQKFIGKVGKFVGKGAYKAPWAAIKSTGIPGGVQQSWKKNVTDRLDRSQKTREARWAGRLGDKGAAERNMKTRSAEYEKNNETIEDLKQWAAKGDTAAAYSLATRGKMDPGTFKTIMDKLKAQKDTRTMESLMGKTSESRMDVTLQYKLDLDKAKAASADPVVRATAKGWANITAVAEHEYGGLTAEEWSKQKDLPEQFKDPIVKAAAKTSFGTLDTAAKTEAFKRMNGKNADAIKKP